MSDKITRREAAKALGTGFTILPVLGAQHQHVAAQAAVAAPPYTLQVFSAAEAELVAALSEAMIPATDTPGARAARVHEYIDQTLSGNKKMAEVFLSGARWVDQQSAKRFGKPFAQLEAAQQAELLARISDAQNQIAPDDKPGAAFFRQLKPMVCTGFYTSQVGLEQEIGYKGNTFLTEFKGCDDQGELLPGPQHRHKRRRA